MKGKKDLLSSVLKTAQMGQVGIRCILKQPIGYNLQNALQSQLNEYSSIEREAHRLAVEKGITPEELNPAVIKMASIMTDMQLKANHTDSKAAAMMIHGNTRGMIKGYKNLHAYNHSDQSIADLGQKLLAFEEANIRQMQGFL